MVLTERLKHLQEIKSIFTEIYRNFAKQIHESHVHPSTWNKYVESTGGWRINGIYGKYTTYHESPFGIIRHFGNRI